MLRDCSFTVFRIVGCANSAPAPSTGRCATGAPYGSGNRSERGEPKEGRFKEGNLGFPSLAFTGEPSAARETSVSLFGVQSIKVGFTPPE
jgi:hypothetical protein